MNKTQKALVGSMAVAVVGGLVTGAVVLKDKSGQSHDLLGLTEGEKVAVSVVKAFRRCHAEESSRPRTSREWSEERRSAFRKAVHVYHVKAGEYWPKARKILKESGGLARIREAEKELAVFQKARQKRILEEIRKNGAPPLFEVMERDMRDFMAAERKVARIKEDAMKGVIKQIGYAPRPPISEEQEKFLMQPGLVCAAIVERVLKARGISMTQQSQNWYSAEKKLGKKKMLRLTSPTM